MRRSVIGWKRGGAPAAGFALAAVLALAGVGAAAGAGVNPDVRVIILGFDGMDHELTTRLMAAGRLPHLAELAREGTFAPLGTSVPPQSPVAWSDFITGMDAGGHGIFDFIHRDPKTLQPYLSTSRATGAEKVWKLGDKWQLPLGGGEVELLRRGEAFWEVLERNGVETTIIRIPANFPPSGTASRELSGMGTPDILGTYGTFSFFTTDYAPFEGRDIGGGKVYEVVVRDGVVRAALRGPANPYRVKKDKVRAEFSVYLDPVEPVALVTIGGEERLLREGEWSGWVPVEFPLLPASSTVMTHVLAAADGVLPTRVHGMVRFYLKQIRPQFELYVSPVNLDPFDPEMPISTPADYAAELAEASGRYYTQGMPEDTKALSEKVLTMAEFLVQAHLAGEENIHQYEQVLAGFDHGLLFYYFGNADQTSHMMWRPMDPGHPAYDAARDAPFADAVPAIYETFDRVVGYTREHMPEGTLLVVMSDHGFTSWRRSFHLNAWLRDNGYLAELDPDRREDPGFLANVDWSRTRAYGYGLNGLYLNLQGRERYGIVPPGKRQALLDEIASKLTATLDPATGKPAVSHVFDRDQTYRDRGAIEIGPDLIIGTAKGTRISDDSALGKVPRELFSDNTDEWSGDHCMDPAAVPGVLFTNRPLRKPAPALRDLAAAVLAEFGIDGFPAPRGTGDAAAGR